MRKWLFNFTANKLVRLISSNDQPYLERYRLCKLFGYRFYLHRFVNGDGEEWFHDHPWDALSIVLTGHYVEQSIVGLDLACGWHEVSKKVRWFNYIHAGGFHRIDSAAPETWTLMIVGPRQKNWGFLKRGSVVDNLTEAMVIYHNPFEQDEAENWKTAALGKDSRRARFLESLNDIEPEDMDGGFDIPERFRKNDSTNP